MNMQKAAEQSVNSLLPTYYNDANGLTQPQGALVAIDPKTGYIKAMVGRVVVLTNSIVLYLLYVNLVQHLNHLLLLLL